jgi:xylose isomerase
MDYFPNFGKIKYEGSQSNNPFAFKYYNPDEVILGKKMKEHLKFSLAYWHAMTGSGKDQFGDPTMERRWDDEHEGDTMKRAEARVHAAFELMEKLGLEYFCFHDCDIAPEGKTLAETRKNLDTIVAMIEAEMHCTGIRLLWGTANLFSHRRYVNGAATSPNADVFAYAAAQTKKALEITHRLHGAGYVFWGGREGYETLLNTDMKLEQELFARFLKMAVDYAAEIGFTGQFYIEPKPKEPTKHQYDFDCATVISFLRKYHLENHFKLNVEVNHATLAAHTMNHELRVAADNGMLGSVDANQGDPLLGWDTDQFPTNLYEATLTMYEILRAGGLKTGGLNFDAKVRRSSFTEEDLLLGHIAGMDTYAAGLRVAARLWKDQILENNLKHRYRSYSEGIGARIQDGSIGFRELDDYVLEKGELQANEPGRQEFLEAILNQYLLG